MSSVRECVIREMQQRVGAEKWQANEKQVDEIKGMIIDHPINNHEVINLLKNGRYSKDEMCKMHLEYREIVMIFTDALLMAQYNAYQVDQKMKAGSKALPRFLLTLNVLDEFGFRYSDAKGNSYFTGDPNYSHLILFEQLMTDLGVSDEERKNYTGSEVTNRLKQSFLSAYDDFLVLSLYLCIAEQIVLLFSPNMRRNVDKVGVDVGSGYYMVHGASYDAENHGCDDYHEDDLFAILNYAMEPDDLPRLRKEASHFLNEWYAFWSQSFVRSAKV